LVLAFADIMAIEQLWKSHQTRLQKNQFLKEYAAWNQWREEVDKMHRDNECKQYDRENYGRSGRNVDTARVAQIVGGVG
jgi:hypothetical protein